MTQGERLKKAIERSGLLSSKIADMLGISANYLSMMTGDRRPIPEKLADKLARTLNVRKDWLLTGDGQMEADPDYVSRLSQLVADLLADDEDSFKIRFISEMAKLPPDAWANVEAFIDKLLDK